MKIPRLTALAPSGSEPPFAAAQGIALVIFVVLALWAIFQVPSQDGVAVSALRASHLRQMTPQQRAVAQPLPRR